MNLNESVSKLQGLLSNLKAGDAKFASDLIASYKKYKGLTPKQEPWIGRLIARAETPAFQVVKSYPATPEPVNVGGFSGVINLFNTAKAHLKFPKVRLVVNGVKVIVSLNGPKSKAPGFVSIAGEGVYPNRTYYGRVSPEGAFTPSHAAYGEFLSALTALLVEFGTNPARVAKDHGKLTGNCCFCGKVLGLGEDKRSVLVGYGPVCAEHYGLKAEWLSGVAKAEAKANVAAVVEYEKLTVGEPTVAAVAAEIETWGPDFVAVSEPEVVANPEYTQTPENAAAEALAAEVTCFFCEQPSTETKTLHGYTVCSTCAKQLVSA